MPKGAPQRSAESPADPPDRAAEGKLPRGVLAVAILVSAVAALYPIWSVRFLPFLDLPTHLAMVSVAQHLGDPAWGLDGFYQAAYLPTANWAYYFPVRALSTMFSIETANRIFLSAYILAVPITVYALARRFNRSRWLCLFGFPLALNHSLGMGYVPYCAGIVSALFTLAVLDAYLENPTRRRLAWLAAGAVATALFHVVALGVLFVLALPILISTRDRNRSAALTACGLLVLLTSGAALNYHFIAGGRVVAETTEVTEVRVLGTAMESVDRLHRRLLIHWPNPHPAGADDITLVILAAAWLVLAAGGTRKEAGLRAWMPELCFSILAAGYFLLPSTIARPFALVNLNIRLLMPLTLFGAVMISGRISRWRQVWILVLVAATVFYSAGMTRRFRSFDVEARLFSVLIANVPQKSSLLFLDLSPKASPVVADMYAPFRSIGGYAQLEKGGYNPALFDVAYPARAIPDQRLPHPPAKRAAPFSFDGVGARYDYIATRGESADSAVLAGAKNRGVASIVARSGSFRLYKVRRAP